MSLIDDFKAPCVKMVKKSVDDGEGGKKTDWAKEGEPFLAAITFNNSLEARVAERQGVNSLYTVTVAKDTKLRYHDVIKRLADNKILRITSDDDDIRTPKRASFSFAQVTAEEWELT